MPLNNIVSAHADVPGAANLATGRSTAGHVVFVAGAPVIWRSKVQTLVTLSTTEAKFVNLTPAGQALGWVWLFIKKSGLDIEKPFLLFTDSLNARHNVLNKNNTARTHHIDIRFKWIVES